MTELFLVTLLGAGMTVLMWSTIGEIAILVRETAEDWINGFREETGTHPKSDYMTHGTQIMVYEHIRLLLQITIGMGTDRSVRAYPSYWQNLFFPGSDCSFRNGISALWHSKAQASENQSGKLT